MAAKRRKAGWRGTASTSPRSVSERLPELLSSTEVSRSRVSAEARFISSSRIQPPVRSAVTSAPSWK